MYPIHFYKDRNGHEPVREYIETLSMNSSKDSRIKLHKIQDYLTMLKNRGTMIGEPFIKHLEGDIWELRPLRDRILFAAWLDDGFILLHYFVKKTQKTPRRELMKAQKALDDIRKRGL
ncbi:type II toxin-antitoxin system RelE/ParE family toxin [Streptococcus salivarius]